MSSSGPSPERLFDAVLAAQPSRPLITFYDDASGARVELSAKSMANWVTKTHYLLTDELGLGVGDTALVALPAHWLTVPVLIGCWSAGLSVDVAAPDASVAFVTGDLIPAAVPDVYAIDPQSLTGSFGASPPDGALDYVSAVRPQADAWATVRFPGGPGDAAVGGLSRTDVVARAAKRAAELGMAPGARVLAERPWTSTDDWIDALLAPLSVLGSIVLVANASATAHERRVAQENVTAVLEPAARGL